MLKLANISDLKDEKGLIVPGRDGQEIALFKVGDQIFAIDNTCPHMGGPLGEGEISVETGKPVVTCPWHGWEFDIRSGECINCPGDDARRVEIVIEGDEIFLV